MPPVTTALGHRTSRALGTFATVLTTEAAALERAHALLTKELLAVDAACSRFRRDAELWRVNHAKGRPVRVSPLLGEALTVALTAPELLAGVVALSGRIPPEVEPWAVPPETNVWAPRSVTS